MPAPLRLLCVLAHPDDESLGTGGALAACAREGIETYVVTAAKGERLLWGTQEFDRALSLVNGGRAKESDLFAGLR